MLKNTAARKPQEQTAPQENAKARELTFAEKLAEDIARGEMMVGIDAVAAFFHVSIREAHRWQESHADFPVDKAGGRWLTCRERLETWFEAHRGELYPSNQGKDTTLKPRERRW